MESTENASEFIERIDFRQSGDGDPDPALLRLLTLLISLSYYKATATTRIEIGFPTTSADRRLFAEVIRHGLGEYAYRNDMPEKLTPKINGEDLAPKTEPSRNRYSLGAAPFVAVGGGRDSIISIEALRGLSPVLWSVNGRGAIPGCVRMANLPYVQIERNLDPQLSILNSQGAPNGHVPVTAMVSVIGLIAAELGGYGPVVLSNERSAEYGNVSWSGQTINHQWSKSLAFESLLRDWLSQAGRLPDSYFSLLRAFGELDVARLFSKQERYFGEFSSCNRAYTESPTGKKWCGACAKCVFVYLTLAPFLGRERLTAIFGRDVLDDPANVDMVRDLIGQGSIKPFDCVGEPREAQEALAKLTVDPLWKSARVVAAFAGLEPSADWRHEPSEDRVPARFAPVRDALIAELT